MGGHSDLYSAHFLVRRNPDPLFVLIDFDFDGGWGPHFAHTCTYAGTTKKLERHLLQNSCNAFLIIVGVLVGLHTGHTGCKCPEIEDEWCHTLPGSAEGHYYLGGC